MSELETICQVCSRFHRNVAWLAKKDNPSIAIGGLLILAIRFTVLPALGTWETLRGFENFRFRDRSALSLTAEYRYRIQRHMDWAFFLDEGQVAPRPRDFGWDRFHTGYGFRWFIYPKPSFPIAIDFSRGAEKSHRLYINLNTTF
jgi:hypothetical protein